MRCPTPMAFGGDSRPFDPKDSWWIAPREGFMQRCMEQLPRMIKSYYGLRSVTTGVGRRPSSAEIYRAQKAWREKGRSAALCLLALLFAAPASAAPIYTNFGDDVIVTGAPDTLIVWSEDDLSNHGAFWDLGVFTGHPIMSNPFDPWDHVFDGRVHTYTWHRSVFDKCRHIQGDLSGPTNPGRGFLIAGNGLCDSTEPPIIVTPPVCITCGPPPCTDCEPPLVVPVPESSSLTLLALGFAGLVIWRVFLEDDERIHEPQKTIVDVVTAAIFLSLLIFAAVLA